MAISTRYSLKIYTKTPAQRKQRVDAQTERSTGIWCIRSLRLTGSLQHLHSQMRDPRFNALWVFQGEWCFLQKKKSDALASLSLLNPVYGARVLLSVALSSVTAKSIFYDTIFWGYFQYTTAPSPVFSFGGDSVQFARRDCSVCSGQGVQWKRNIHEGGSGM